MRSLAILVPNYNGEAFIAETVRRFSLGFPDAFVIVVDDASTDDSLTVLSASEAKLLVRATNGGFAAAVNTGLKYLVEAGFDDVLVANSDIAADEPTCHQIASALRSAALEPNTTVLGFLEESATNTSSHRGCDISGFLFAMRLEMLAEVGYFDESFYMYGEEQDYFRRVIEAGFSIHQTGIRVRHLSEGSGSSKLRNSWLAIRNSLYLEVKRFAIRKTFRKVGVLFLIINRLYRPQAIDDPSVRRVLRPGIILGNILLLTAIFWNLTRVARTLIYENKSESGSKS